VSRPRILLTGRTGQVGWELQRTLACLGELTCFDSRSMDLNDSAAIGSGVERARPDIIVNAAAYTQVDKAESDRDAAHRINAIAPGLLAEHAERLGAIMVHYSTDYVFDGTGEHRWSEDDAPNPLNVYGETKLAGEQAVASVCARHLVLRTSWVYGTRGANFLLTMRRLMQERDALNIVNDQVGSPTWSRMIAEATSQVLTLVNAGCNDAWGIYHLTSSGSGSWFDFASAIREHGDGAYRAELSPIPTSAYPTPATRPLNSRLSNHKLRETFGIALPDWRDALDLCLG
jgi:dTDP-4-dehydrorhamnose reductase